MDDCLCRICWQGRSWGENLWAGSGNHGKGINLMFKTREGRINELVLKLRVLLMSWPSPWLQTIKKVHLPDPALDFYLLLISFHPCLRIQNHLYPLAVAQKFPKDAGKADRVVKDLPDRGSQPLLDQPAQAGRPAVQAVQQGHTRHLWKWDQGHYCSKEPQSLD